MAALSLERSSDAPQVESADTEVEGWLTSQEALPSPLRLKFQLPYNRWTTSVAADGSYHVTAWRCPPAELPS